MKLGVCLFFTVDSVSPLELAPALEERGFESLWVPEHTHIPLETRERTLGSERSRCRPGRAGPPSRDAAHPQERAIVAAARAGLGDRYDTRRYPGGPPPPGRGACTDVVWRACLPVVDLQGAVARDRASQGLPVDRELDYRWCPFLLRWFERHAQRVEDWRPGDIVFWLDGHGVAFHCGVVSDRWAGVRRGQSVGRRWGDAPGCGRRRSGR